MSDEIKPKFSSETSEEPLCNTECPEYVGDACSTGTCKITGYVICEDFPCIPCLRKQRDHYKFEAFFAHETLSVFGRLPYDCITKGKRVVGALIEVPCGEQNPMMWACEQAAKVELPSDMKDQSDD